MDDGDITFWALMLNKIWCSTTQERNSEEKRLTQVLYTGPTNWLLFLFTFFNCEPINLPRERNCLLHTVNDCIHNAVKLDTHWISLYLDLDRVWPWHLTPRSRAPTYRLYHMVSVISKPVSASGKSQDVTALCLRKTCMVVQLHMDWNLYNLLCFVSMCEEDHEN